MPRKNAAVEEARDLRGALEAIGRIIGDGTITPKGRLQQVVGILGIYDVRTVVAPSTKPPFNREAAKTFSAEWLHTRAADEEQALFCDVPAGTGE